MIRNIAIGPLGMWWGRWDLLPALNGDISRDPLFLSKLRLRLLKVIMRRGGAD